MASVAIPITKPPKTRKGKRVLEKREPQVVEVCKTAMFIRTTQTSQFMTQVLTDLYLLKKPDAVWYRRKGDNHILPFEDMTSIEFFSTKSDASLFALGTHTKKRPNNLILGRLFNYHLLDMIEFGVEDYKPLSEFKTDKQAIGSKPMFVLDGDLFATDENIRIAGNLIVDFFRGHVVDQINLAGLDHLIQLTAADGVIYFRHYLVRFKKSGTNVPRIELEEMGPSMNLRIRRTKLASDDLRNTALKQPKQPKKQKNVTTTVMRDTVGTVHMPTQDLDKLVTKIKKPKALRSKRSRRNSTGSSAGSAEDNMDVDE